MTKDQAYAKAVELVDEHYELAAADAERMLTRHGASTSEVASALARMAAEHAKLRRDGIDQVFHCLTGETVH